MVLRGLDRKSVPEFKPTRERRFWYPRAYKFKQDRIPGEVQALIKAAKAKGLDESAVDSIWLKGQQAKDDFDRVNGMLLPVNEEAGLEHKQHPM